MIRGCTPLHTLPELQQIVTCWIQFLRLLDVMFFKNRYGTFHRQVAFPDPYPTEIPRDPVSGRDDHTANATGRGKFIVSLEGGWGGEKARTHISLTMCLSRCKRTPHPQCILYYTIFYYNSSNRQILLVAHLTVRETEAQRGEVTCPPTWLLAGNRIQISAVWFQSQSSPERRLNNNKKLTPQPERARARAQTAGACKRTDATAR